MSEIRNSIRERLFESEKSLLLREFEENDLLDKLAEGIVWDFLNTDIGDIVHGGISAGIKRKIKSQLDKTIGKDNKTINKAIDLLKKAYGNRISKLSDLKNKVAGKISRNKTLTPQEKAELTKAIQDRIDDSSEILKALDGEQLEIAAEIAPVKNAPKGQTVQSTQPEPELEVEPEEEPEAEPEPEKEIDPESEKVNSIISSVDELGELKVNKFKVKMKVILNKNAPTLVQRAIEKVGSITERVLEEDLEFDGGLEKLSKVASPTISNALRSKPKLKREYDKLPNDKKFRVNNIILIAVIKATKKSLGSKFFSDEDEEIVEPEITDTTPEDEPEAIEEPGQKPDEIETPAPDESKPDSFIPDDGELEPIQTADDTDEIQTEPEVKPVSPEVKPASPVDKPETKKAPVITNTLQSASVEKAAGFLREKGLLSKGAYDLFNKLKEPNKKQVINFAIDTISKVTNQNLNEKKLTPAELGLPDDFEIGNTHQGIVKTLATAISNKVRRLHKQELKSQQPKAKSPEVKKTEPKKAPEPIKAPEVKKAEPKKAPEPIKAPEPKKSPEVKKTEPKKAPEPIKAPEVKKAEPKKDLPFDKEVPSTKSDAKAQIAQSKAADKAETKPEVAPPVSVPTPKPQPEAPKAEVQPEVDIESKMTNDLGPEMMDSIMSTEDTSFIRLAKKKYMDLKNRAVKIDVIKNQLDTAIDQWYEQQGLIEEGIKNAIHRFGGGPKDKDNLRKQFSPHKYVVSRNLQTIQKGDIVSYSLDENKDEKKKNKLSEGISPAAAKLLSNDQFKGKVEDDIKQGKQLGLVIEVKHEEKIPVSVKIQPMIGSRSKLNPDKMSLKKNGKVIEVNIKHISQIEIPKKTIPSDIFDKLKLMMIPTGIAAAGVGGALGKLAQIGRDANAGR